MQHFQEMYEEAWKQTGFPEHGDRFFECLLLAQVPATAWVCLDLKVHMTNDHESMR